MKQTIELNSQWQGKSVVGLKVMVFLDNDQMVIIDTDKVSVYVNDTILVSDDDAA